MVEITWKDSLVGSLCFEAYKVDCRVEGKEPSDDEFEFYWQQLRSSGQAGHMTAPSIGERAVVAGASAIPFVVRITWKIIIPVLRQACDLIATAKFTTTRLTTIIRREVEKYGGEKRIKEELVDVLATAVATNLAMN